MLNVRYLDPTARTFDETVVGWLLSELEGAKGFRLASGYLDGKVLDWLEKPIADIASRGGTLSAVVGSNGGETSSESVARLHEVFGDSLYVEYAEGGVFHPKVYVVEHDDRTSAAVGSANFTSASATINVEATLIVETDQLGPPPEEPLASIIRSVDPARHPHATQVTSVDEIQRLSLIGVLDRAVRRAPQGATAGASNTRHKRQAAGFDRRAPLAGIQPAPSRPKRAAVPTKVEAPPLETSVCGLRFSANDLKSVGTREISVSSGIRTWAEGILGRSIEPGEGTLFEVDIDARLLASPANVVQTAEPVRIWAAGGSGGTHQDVRLVLGSTLKDELDEIAKTLTGQPIEPESIGVFELPDAPGSDVVRLTIVLPDDPEYVAVAARLGTQGREQKPHFELSNRPNEIPDWPGSS